jgi:hypothetical protein
MNVTMNLLFNLDIPLNYLNKLDGYYYIPENEIGDLKLGGFVYIVDRLIPIKTIRYCGILSSFNSEDMIMGFVKNDRIDYGKFHIFYRPKKSRIQTAITLLSAIQ